MGKGYKRKTRWRTLNIDAPPGEEDEEGAIRNGYASKGQENGTGCPKNGQQVHKSVRTDSAGSATSDYASDYASAVSNKRREDAGVNRVQPKIIFNENEYTRITAPRQDVLFKKDYLSRKKVWASTASTSATPSTTESQSASHSTADGSETTEDQQLLDCKENDAKEYPAMMDSGLQMTYGTFYDRASGYYYEYPVMVVGPGPGVPGAPPMHNVLTAVPCGPVPLRPIEWVNPAFAPKYDDEQYCVVDYQTSQLGQYPTLADESGLPLATMPYEDSKGSEEPVGEENGANGSANWTESAWEDEQASNSAEPQPNWTPDVGPSVNGAEEEPTATQEEQEEQQEPPVNNSEVYLETELAQQLHVSQVPVPPTFDLYVYPGHYMFGPSLINVNGVTIQSGPMVRNYGITGGPANTGAWAKRRKKRQLSRRRSRQPPGPGNAEDEKQDEEEGLDFANYHRHQKQPGVPKDAVDGFEMAENASTSGDHPAVGTTMTATTTTSTTTSTRALNPNCPEFRPILAFTSVESTTATTTTSTASSSSVETSSGPSSGNGRETPEKAEQTDTPAVNKIEELPVVVSSSIVDVEHVQAKSGRTLTESSITVTSPGCENGRKIGSRDTEDKEAAPVDFAVEVFANVSIMAERALATRGVVEGTPMETEIGLDATDLNFQEIANDLETRSREDSTKMRYARAGDQDLPDLSPVANGLELSTIKNDSDSSIVASNEKRTSPNDKRGSRSESPGIINRTTTPINANSQRLPKSYESLVTRSDVSSSLPCLGATSSLHQSQNNHTRNRRYSAKGTKFVREPTPGPDLEERETTSTRREIARSDRISGESSNGEEYGNDPEIVAMGIEVHETTELQLCSLPTTEDSFWTRAANNADVSNDDSGVETQTRYSSSGHPITDAVTEWLQRANSPDMFVTPNSGEIRSQVSESEPEDDELENDEPPKNLQGNPTPALSANGTDRANVPAGTSRLACHGKFASLVRHDVNERIEESAGVVLPAVRHGGDESSTCREKRREKCHEKMASKNAKSGENCEFTETDRVAGVRVAKSSRTRRCDAFTRRARRNERAARNGSSNRRLPIENVEIGVKKITGDERDEGIVEDNDDEVDEQGVKTFEKGRIVVSIEGKVLPLDNYRAVMLTSDQTISPDGIDECPTFRKITCVKSRSCENEEKSSESGEASKINSLRNSLCSIEEPDVLECWEIETVEPISTPRKRPPLRGVSLLGEDNEEDPQDVTILDPIGMEYVRKYYRLEAMRDSVTSLEDDDDSKRPDDSNVVDVSGISILKSPGDEFFGAIPIMADRVDKILGSLLDKSGVPIDEAIEVYESCYGPKENRDFGQKSQGHLYARDPEGAVPCRAACCNVQ